MRILAKDCQWFLPGENAAERILGALWEMLSSVCRRHAIAC